MKALMPAHQELTREAFLRRAGEVPGAWIGISGSAIMLMLAGCSCVVYGDDRECPTVMFSECSLLIGV